jgi:hypothetical protein
MDRIARIFDAYFGQWDIPLPLEALTTRRPGRLSASGWTIHYLFGTDEKGDYLDFYAQSRMTNDRHVRIRATGETEMLPAIRDAVVYPAQASDEERREIEQECRRHNTVVAAELRRKGFL